MAEKGAHLTLTTHPKPSIFEIIAQDSLNSTIHPALQRFVTFLSTYYGPKKFNLLVQYFDEIYLFLNTIIQYNYIKKYNASFSEQFYGLKRIDQSTGGNLTKRHKILTLLCLTIVPYVKLKIEDKLTLYRLELADGLVHNRWKRKLKTLLCSCHGLFHFSWILWTVSQYLKYMSGKTDVQTPLLKLLALKLVYETEEESTSGFWSKLFQRQLTFGLIGEALSNTLEMGAFFIQFLRSWQEENSHVNITALPLSDPPEYDPNSVQYKRKCPLCMQEWKIPTVVTVSGYVYCFRCIVNHLHESNSCPVTRFPTDITGIVRLYGVGKQN